jgi:cation diffusion facilitator family transporter
LRRGKAASLPTFGFCSRNLGHSHRWSCGARVALTEIFPLWQSSTAAATRFATRLSLIFGILMLLGNGAAYLLTGSAAILSDAAESVVHVVAVGFAAFSLWLNSLPANQKYLYGYEPYHFLFCRIEGAMIVLAAFAIIYAAIHKWMTGLRIEKLGLGTLFVLAASIINPSLGWYLVRTGRKNNSLILEASGKHGLTDGWTSFGAAGGLCLVLITGRKPFDLSLPLE